MPFGFQFEKTALSNFLKGLSYPVDKAKLLQIAAEKDLPQQVIATLQRLPDRQFSSAEEINSQLPAKAA